MLNLNDFAKEVHRVAVEHGWYDGQETRSTDEIIALIHSEWSEALEEYRAGRPMLWHECMNCHEPCMEDSCGDWYDGECALGELAKKPEGIMIELIDGCIRILDYMGHKKYCLEAGRDNVERLAQAGELIVRARCSEGFNLPSLIALLHWQTAVFHGDLGVAGLISPMASVFFWIQEQGFDPEELLRMKHEYNKTRPYKHGGKRC